MINFKQFYLLEKIRRLLLIILLSIGFFLVLLKPLPVLAETKTPPKTCYMGIYLLNLHDFNLLGKTFDADFWIWSICPTPDFNPIETLDIINAENTTLLNQTTLEKKDKFNLFPNVDKVYWSQVEVNTTILYNWNINSYPFDRHVLTIPIEESLFDNSTFVYTPDLKNSNYKKDLKFVGWKLTKFEVTMAENTYNTTFGNPELESKSSTYSQLLIKVYIERNSFLGFLKLAAGVYISAGITFLSFFLKSKEEIGSRTGLLVGCLFATIVNMQVADSMLGSSPHLTLVDKIHITTIFYIAIATLVSIYSHLIADRGQEDKATFLDRKISFPLFTISFIILNLVIISNAIKTG